MVNDRVTKIGVVGGTGYTGVELLRLLILHPEVELHVVCSRSEAGKCLIDVYPNLSGVCSDLGEGSAPPLAHLNFLEPNVHNLSSCDLVFFATPNGIAMNYAQELLDQGIKLIDLAADFRFKDLDIWQQWYRMEHAAPNLSAQAVYGLPEINRQQLKDADLVGSAGCYTTAAQLALLPLLQKEHQSKYDWSRIIIDAKSGVSGAGKSLTANALFSEAAESFSAYGVSGHRHLPEICHSLKNYSGVDIGLTFTPHLVPMVRGILTTSYVPLTEALSVDQIQNVFEEFYADELFVDVLASGSLPSTKSVRGSNLCRIAVHLPNPHTLVIISVIDNLVKGASGQAVQNMNLMLGIPEYLGLQHIPLYP